MDRWIDGWMDRWIDGWMNGWMDERMQPPSDGIGTAESHLLAEFERLAFVSSALLRQTRNVTDTFDEVKS